VPEAAERLRHSVTRLARLLRQQDEGGFGATQTAALASVKNRGPLTLGELAACEQVAPPTMTKVVEKLEAHGFVTRQVDQNDRRVSRVTVTAAGRRHLDATRQRRTAWLAGRLHHLPADQLDRLMDALDVLETLIATDAPPTDVSGRQR
jgi:DNA-binding MarR family transcriptional regulator